MELQEILLIILVVFVIGLGIFIAISDNTSSKKEKKAKVYQSKSERDLMYQIHSDKKENKWDIYDITLLKQTDDYISVVVIFEVR